MLKLYTTGFNVELYGAHTTNAVTLDQAKQLVQRELDQLAKQLQQTLASQLSVDANRPAQVFIDGEFLL